jgi:hypothetical protein
MQRRFGYIIGHKIYCTPIAVNDASGKLPVISDNNIRLPTPEREYLVKIYFYVYTAIQ